MTNSALLSPPPFPAHARNIVDRSTQRHLRSLYLELRRGQIKGATDVALNVARALRRVISGAKFTALDDLYAAVRLTGVWLQDARRGEQAISNVTLRALHVLAEEARALIAEANESGMDSMASSQVLSSPSSPAAGPRSIASPGPATPSKGVSEGVIRPQYRRADSTFFGHGSTFSIADLVAAGQNAHSLPGSSGWNSAVGSGTTTPAMSLSRAVSTYGDISFGAAAVSLQRPGRSADDDDATAKSDDEAQADEDEDEEEDEDEDDTQQDDLRAASSREDSSHLKPLLLQAVEELIDELDSARSNIARDARDHIHSGEVVLTMGYSRTIEAFLKQASRDRTFTLMVADSGSSKAATKLSASLPKSIRILSIPHSSIFTLLPRITKVLVSAHTVLANGGLLASPGCSAALLAAKVHSTPVLVLAGLHKVCSDWRWVGLASPTSSSTMPIVNGPTSQGAFASTTIADAATSHGQGTAPTSSSLAARSIASPLAGDLSTGPPQSVLLTSLSSNLESVKEVILNEFDYVEPENVDVLITNTGEYPSSYVYRLISENFAAVA